METLIEYMILPNLLIIVTFLNWNLLDYHLPGLIKGVLPAPFLKIWIEFL